MMYSLVGWVFVIVLNIHAYSYSRAGIGTLDALQRVKDEHTQLDDVTNTSPLPVITKSVLANTSSLVEKVVSNVTQVAVNNVTTMAESIVNTPPTNPV